MIVVPTAATRPVIFWMVAVHFRSHAPPSAGASSISAFTVNAVPMPLASTCITTRLPGTFSMIVNVCLSVVRMKLNPGRTEHLIALSPTRSLDTSPGTIFTSSSRLVTNA